MGPVLECRVELVEETHVVLEIETQVFTPYLSIAMRSIPMPKANPEYFSGSMLFAWSTLGSTMPQPMISSQPVPLQTGQPLPPQRLHDTSTSAEGSVKGKYEGRMRMTVCSPKTSLAK